MERNIIAIIGVHGSGKSRLAKNVVERLQPTQSIDHLGVGDTIRKIGRGVIKSNQYEAIRDHLNSPQAHQLLNDEIMYEVMQEAFSAYQSSDTILADGFPRTSAQADQLDTLAVLDSRKIAGFIMTNASDKDAIMRMISRGPRDYEGSLSVSDALARVKHDRVLQNDMALPMHFPSLPFEVIDTSASTEVADSTRAGLRVVSNMIHTNNPQ